MPRIVKPWRDLGGVVHGGGDGNLSSGPDAFVASEWTGQRSREGKGRATVVRGRTMPADEGEGLRSWHFLERRPEKSVSSEVVVYIVEQKLGRRQ